MSWILFDEHGERAQKLTVVMSGAYAVYRGWGHDFSSMARAVEVMGFDPERTWRPTWFAAKMAKGYRVFEVDTGALEYIEEPKALEIWRPAASTDKRLPSLAAVEMWVRHQAMRVEAADEAVR